MILGMAIPRQERDIGALHEMLQRVTSAIWNRRADGHLWSIPVDHDRDFDMMFSDAFTELAARRAAMKDAGLALPDHWKQRAC